MVIATTNVLTGALHGLRAAAAMLWMTWWPLVFGFALAGMVQAFVRRDQLSARLGVTTPRSVLSASALGVISSSCSYAASAMARALFSRGASWTNAMVFMIASTNLVVELGIVLWILLGWQYLVAELVGGAIMIVLVALLMPRLFDPSRAEQLRARVQDSSPNDAGGDVASVRHLDGWTRAARYARGDMWMLRRELVIGFLVAGVLAADVPSSWWRAVFVTGHGNWTLVENVVVAPLVAVASFVCSVGNIPLAAALDARGVAFGGVVAFIFADLVTLPLLAIYRRFYGTGATLRIGVCFWFAMSTAGLLVDLLTRASGRLPHGHVAAATAGRFELGATLWLNIAAVAVVLGGVWLSRRELQDNAVSIDPVCAMQVAHAGAAATFTYRGLTYYFCAPRCAERFEREPDRFVSSGPAAGEAPKPVCERVTVTRKPHDG